MHNGALEQTPRLEDPQGACAVWGANLISDLQAFDTDSLEDKFYIVIRYNYTQA